MTTVALVLAAGQGSRMGGTAKALLSLPGDEKTFLERIAETGKAVRVDSWLVVTGMPHAIAVEEHARTLGMDTIRNPAPERGMSSSIELAFTAALENEQLGQAFLWPVDHPRVAAETLKGLLAEQGECVTPVFRGRGGHPPLVRRALWQLLSAASHHPDGARGILRGRRSLFPVADSGVTADIDHPEDLR